MLLVLERLWKLLQYPKLKQQYFFYNPNIHPQEEYEIRKDENKRFCDKLGFDFIDADYDKDNWF